MWKLKERDDDYFVIGREIVVQNRGFGCYCWVMIGLELVGE